MINENNKVMEKTIRDWGLPKTEYMIQNQESIEFIFDENGPEKTKYQEQKYHCKDGDVQFYLYDKLNNKTLFSMGFRPMNSFIAKKLLKKEKAIKLELLYVHEDALRKKGISTYYIRKLQKYAYDEGVECISVTAYANLEKFKHGIRTNALNQAELEGFYKRLSTNEMPIVIS
ncbi:GNAT family N-acetyltransferase [Bacillus cereus group sp. MG68]|uniref:GNAT family N-acetyltransferase n=1 Tax=Bacillus cereus group sp. MG68 TaxID=3040253 RepID=UPI00339928BC